MSALVVFACIFGAFVGAFSGGALVAVMFLRSIGKVIGRVE